MDLMNLAGMTEDNISLGYQQFYYLKVFVNTLLTTERRLTEW